MKTDVESDKEIPEAAMEVSDASDDGETCPLFMTGLPQQFSSNAALCALASLFSDDNEKSEDENNSLSPKSEQISVYSPSQLGKSCGGKARRVKSSARRAGKNSPYCHSGSHSTRKHEDNSSVNELSVFVKLWGISK